MRRYLHEHCVLYRNRVNSAIFIFVCGNSPLQRLEIKIKHVPKLCSYHKAKVNLESPGNLPGPIGIFLNVFSPITQ